MGKINSDDWDMSYSNKTITYVGSTQSYAYGITINANGVSISDLYDYMKNQWDEDLRIQKILENRDETIDNLLDDV